MKKLHKGSCHCGAVRFECHADLSQGTSKCNCSACAKGRFWKAIVMDADFRLLQGADALSTYRFGNNVITHSFCRHCGIKPFGNADIEGLGAFHAVNVACLDELSDAERAALPVKFENGRHNDWNNEPGITIHL